MQGQQLPLSVQLRDNAGFDNFFSGANTDAITALRELHGDVFISGAPGSGRTHLLQAVARTRGGAYLPLADLHAIGAEILEGQEQAATLCLDDLDGVIADRGWALALLRLLDARRSLHLPTVMSADAPPERLHSALPDLRTRLSASAVFGLRPLSDELREQLLRERAQARGLELAPEVSRWLLRQLARDTGSLLAALETLDCASLSAKRRLTLPFVQSVLAPGTAQTG
ncbi:MAG TPA: DnaA regulatory inactivator Hda [Stenotrophobium sp.]|jgi:DnaA family protein|nr:DnaA regulatory inactivator Hda [Stenotrophobium sp.]